MWRIKNGTAHIVAPVVFETVAAFGQLRRINVSGGFVTVTPRYEPRVAELSCIYHLSQQLPWVLGCSHENLWLDKSD
jgi:hypothetical protein